MGWRQTTVDLDLKLDPEPEGVFAAIAEVKNMLDANIELASPDQFVPELPGWAERSIPIERCGAVELLHYDPYGQALAKIARGHARDRADVEAMIDTGLVRPPRLLELFEAVRERLLRYPALDAAVLQDRMERWLDAAR